MQAGCTCGQRFKAHQREPRRICAEGAEQRVWGSISNLSLSRGLVTTTRPHSLGPRNQQTIARDSCHKQLKLGTSLSTTVPCRAAGATGKQQ
eukprot:1152625-Pelagomonas_calceolata.AAC.4